MRCIFFFFNLPFTVAQARGWKQIEDFREKVTIFKESQESFGIQTECVGKRKLSIPERCVTWSKAFH